MIFLKYGADINFIINFMIKQTRVCLIFVLYYNVILFIGKIISRKFYHICIRFFKLIEIRPKKYEIFLIYLT